MAQPSSGISIPDRASTLRLPELDGIRGLAMAMVLVWHYLAGQVHTTPGSLSSYGMRFFSLTWAGVDLFFVLSGFLIGGIILDNRNARSLFKTFYIRRVCRIFPLYYLMLALFATTLLTKLGAAGGSAWDWLFGRAFPVYSYAAFCQNFSMAAAGEMGARWIAITWSLAVEEQFYLILPFLIRLLPERVLPWSLMGLVVSAPVIRTIFYFTHPDAALANYVLLPARWDALFLGVLGALAFRNTMVRDWIAARLSALHILMTGTGLGLLVLLVKGQGIGSVGMTFGGYTALAVFSLGLIFMVLLSPHGFPARCLRNPVRVWTGTVSYGIYLFHEPVSGLLHIWLRGQAPRIASATDALVTLLALSVTLGLAACSWQWFERPIVRLGQRFRYDH